MRFLVESKGSLYGYDRIDVLLCDIASKGQPDCIFQLNDGEVITSYSQITYENLKKQYERGQNEG